MPFTESANRASHAEALYRVEDGHYQFKYLPAFAILTIPLGAVSLEAAKAAWFALSLYDLMGRSAYGMFMSLSLITVCFFIVVGALSVLRARTVA